jgi:hypothetical protein
VRRCESNWVVSVSFIPLQVRSGHCRTFDNMSKVGKKKSRARKINCAFSSLQRSPGKSRCSEHGRNTSDGVRRRTTGWEAPPIDVSPPCSRSRRFLSDKKENKKETKKGKAMHVGYTSSIREFRGFERPRTSLPCCCIGLQMLAYYYRPYFSPGTCYPGPEVRANFVVAKLLRIGITAELWRFFPKSSEYST